jgi:hypothetical protein
MICLAVGVGSHFALELELAFARALESVPYWIDGLHNLEAVRKEGRLQNCFSRARFPSCLCEEPTPWCVVIRSVGSHFAHC